MYTAYKHLAYYVYPSPGQAQHIVKLAHATVTECCTLNVHQMVYMHAYQYIK